MPELHETGDNTAACPHCGTENSRTADLWMHSMGGQDPMRCTNCGQRIADVQDPAPGESKHNKESNFIVRFLAVAILLSGLMVVLNRAYGILNFRDNFTQIIYEFLFILFVSAILASGKIWPKLRYLAIWLGIFLILIAGYSYRHELSGITKRVMAELSPAQGRQDTPDSISFPVSSDGHFHIRAEVNGTPIMFMADTGASHIVLSPRDAKKLGFDLDELRFDRIYETTNGTVRGSSIRINDFRVGPIQLQDISASVNGAEMQGSLLGMTFFKRLASYEVKNDVLTLHSGDGS